MQAMSFRFMALSVAAVLTLAASADVSAQNPTLKTAMRDKLAHTQRLLEAIVHADYPSIARSAEALGRVTDTEIQSWQPGAEPEYRRQAALFTRSVRGLRGAAVARNIDTALSEFTALVSSCTKCHALRQRARPVSFQIRSGP